MKKFVLILILVVVVAVLLLLSLRIYLDYTWAPKTIQEFEEKGFVILDSSPDYSNVTAPWSLVKTPVTSIWFAKKAWIRLNSNYLTVPIVHVQYRYYAGVEVRDYWTVYNLESHEETVILPDSFKKLEDETWQSVSRSESSLAIYREVLSLAGKDSLHLEID